MVGSQSLLSQTKHLFADDSAGADFCHGHQMRALEQSCHFPPASITPLVAVAEVARSQQGLGTRSSRGSRCPSWACPRVFFTTTGAGRWVSTGAASAPTPWDQAAAWGRDWAGAGQEVGLCICLA